MFKDTKTIIFDWDGTLHESMVIYYDAFTVAYNHLVSRGYAKPRSFSKEEVSKFLGVNPKDMWTSVLPTLTDQIFSEASQMVSDAMAKAIADHIYRNSNHEMGPKNMRILARRINAFLDEFGIDIQGRFTLG